MVKKINIETLNKINQALELLYESISIDDESHFSLSSGLLGKSIFLYHYGIYKNNETILSLAHQYFEKAYLQLESHNSKAGMEFLSGYAGIGWVYQYFIRHEVYDYSSGFFELFDQIMMEQCKKATLAKNHDLFYGLLGFGAYFLERARYAPHLLRDKLNSIIDMLRKIAVEDISGLIWLEHQSKDEQRINLGMAHGMASILCFLTNVYGITQLSHAKELALLSAKSLLRYKNPNPLSKEESCFPNVVQVKNSVHHFNSRLAWCNGDLGIGYALYTAGHQLDVQDFQKEGIQILQTCAHRTLENPLTGILDKGFCHGSSGVFHIFYKLYYHYNRAEFEEIAHYWLEQCLQEVNILRSYHSWAGRKEGVDIYHPDEGLLNGYSGIGLCLLSGISSLFPGWDVIFQL